MAQNGVIQKGFRLFRTDAPIYVNGFQYSHILLIIIIIHILDAWKRELNGSIEIGVLWKRYS